MQHASHSHLSTGILLLAVILQCAFLACDAVPITKGVAPNQASHSAATSVSSPNAQGLTAEAEADLITNLPGIPADASFRFTSISHVYIPMRIVLVGFPFVGNS